MLGVQKKKRKTFRFSSFRWGAVGETRTRTGLLPLPPQSSVSTISPPPLCFGIAKVQTFFNPTNIFAKIFNIFLFFHFEMGAEALSPTNLHQKESD